MIRKRPSHDYLPDSKRSDSSSQDNDTQHQPTDTAVNTTGTATTGTTTSIGPPVLIQPSSSRDGHTTPNDELINTIATMKAEM